MIYYMTVDGKSGVAAVKVDGEDVATINADFTSGWATMLRHSRYTHLTRWLLTLLR